MKNSLKIGVLLLCIFLLISTNCDWFECNCDDEMEDIRSDLGEPEEKARYDSQGYHTETWWYWTKGISYTFTWGNDIRDCCEVSTFQFEPVTSENKELKRKIKSNLLSSSGFK
jgi:hypothetical protein